MSWQQYIAITSNKHKTTHCQTNHWKTPFGKITLRFARKHLKEGRCGGRSTITCSYNHVHPTQGLHISLQRKGIILLTVAHVKIRSSYVDVRINHSPCFQCVLLFVIGTKNLTASQVSDQNTFLTFP